MRGEESDELYLYNRKYLTQRQIQDKEKSRAND
jgi:hypothetical protein